jgi:hypothetical protein
MLEDASHVLIGDAAVEWTREGYATKRLCPAAGGDVTTITPPASVDVLRCGYEPQVAAGALQLPPLRIAATLGVEA